MQSIQHEGKKNELASDIQGHTIHISEVDSGRGKKGGYFCLGCKCEVIAKKGDIKQHHFSHDPKDVTRIGKCTHSDETYRHKISKEILQRIKQIQVPNLYKKPPSGCLGKIYLLRKSWTVYAHTVRNELTFYENQQGVIKWVYKKDYKEDKDKYLLIEPDVTFFDEKNNPILLIEILATHKIDSNKLSKITSLKIDTIQIKVPKVSEDAIEQSFYKTYNTEWIYNYEQEQTTYISVPDRDAEGILPISEFQQRIFETGESFSCRASQIRNLNRRLTKIVASEEYRNFDSAIRSEIQRVTENTERERSGIRALEEKYARELREEFRERDQLLEIEGRRIRDGERILSENKRDVEAKYNTEQERIDGIKRKHQFEGQPEIDKLERTIRRIENFISLYRERTSDLESGRKQLRREEDEFIKSYEDKIRGIEENHRIERERIETESAEEFERIRSIGTRRKELPSKYEDFENEIRRGIDNKRTNLQEWFETNRERIGREYAKYGREIIEGLQDRDSKRVFSSLGRAKGTFDCRELFISIAEEKSNLERLYRAKECFDTAAFKNWV